MSLASHVISFPIEANVVRWVKGMGDTRPKRYECKSQIMKSIKYEAFGPCITSHSLPSSLHFIPVPKVTEWGRWVRRALSFLHTSLTHDGLVSLTSHPLSMPVGDPVPWPDRVALARELAPACRAYMNSNYYFYLRKGKAWNVRDRPLLPSLNLPLFSFTSFMIRETRSEARIMGR